MEDELFTVVNWKLKLLDDETPPVWHAGDATRYAEHTNMIHVSIDAVGEGEEELCFEYMRLESCDATKNSASSLALFERLLQKTGVKEEDLAAEGFVGKEEASAEGASSGPSSRTTPTHAEYTNDAVVGLTDVE